MFLRIGRLAMPGVLAAVLMLSSQGVSILSPKPALAAVSITPSSDHWYGPGLMRVLIVDSSRATDGASIAPHIEVKRGAITLASADPPIRSSGTSGTFELYFTTSNAPFAPAFPSDPNNYVVGRISSHPVTQLRDFSLILAPNDYLRDGDSVNISYAGQSETIQFAKSMVVATVDRITAGDGSNIILTLTDQNANIDPTTIDSFSANQSVLSVGIPSGSMNFTGARFIEEGQNSGSFDLVIRVTSAATPTGGNQNNGATLEGVQFPTSAQFTLQGFDVYSNVPYGATYPYDSMTPDPPVTSTKMILLENSDAVITIGNDGGTASNETQTQSGVLLSAKVFPSVIRAGDKFWINATVTNNSTNVIQYSRMCSPSFSVSFYPDIITQGGHVCNIMATLEQLDPGQSTTVSIPGFEGQFFESNMTGAINATVQFQYRLAGQQTDTSQNVFQSFSFSILTSSAGLGENFQLGYNQTVAIKQSNFSIKFANVTEDSRCPSNVECIWPGKASVQVQLLQAPNGHVLDQFILTNSSASNFNSSALAEGFVIALKGVEPHPSGKVKVQLSDYVITLALTEQNSTKPSLAIGAPYASAEGGGQTGNQFRLASSVSSEFSGIQHFTAIFEVRSIDNDTTDFIAFVNGTSFSGEQPITLIPTALWTPSGAGTYQIRVFVVDNLALPRTLGSMSVSQLSLQKQ